MDKYMLSLKLFAPIFFVVACLHLILGVGAEVSLGAEISASSILDPVLDSQNRFYGVIFSIYGVLLYLCASDIQRYRPVFLCLLVVFFCGGLARVVSILVSGLPNVIVIFLMLSELVLPIVAYSVLVALEHRSEHRDDAKG